MKLLLDHQDIDPFAVVVRLQRTDIGGGGSGGGSMNTLGGSGGAAISARLAQVLLERPAHGEPLIVPRQGADEVDRPLLPSA